MKRTLFATMFALIAFMVGCNPTPEPQPEPQPEPPFEGLMMEKADIANLGDFGGNGGTQFILQMATLNDLGGYSNMMSVYFETPEVIEGTTIPEGTFSLLEGDYIDGSYFSGSIYMTTATDENGKLSANWMMITDGTIEIIKNESGLYRFTVKADGYDFYSGESTPKAECRYEGVHNFINNRYNPNWAGALYVPATDTSIPYWILQLDDHYEYLLQFYVNTTAPFEQCIPNGEYLIDDSMAAGHIDASYLVDSFTYGGSVAYKIFEDGGHEADQLMIGGKVNFKSIGTPTEKTSANGDVYIVCQYEIQVVFYNASYIPYLATYQGSVEFYNQGTPEYSNYAYLMYYGNNKWCLMLGDEEKDICPVIYCYGADDTTFESGLTSGTYTVASEGVPFQNVVKGDPFTIQPGLLNGNKLINMSSAFWTYNLTQIWDVLGYGSMDVVNNGDGTYKIDLKLGGALGNVYLEHSHEGPMDEISDNSGSKVAPAQASSPAWHKSPLRGGIKERTNYSFNGPWLR